MSLQMRSMSTGLVTPHIHRVSRVCACACVLSDIRAEYRSSHIGHSWKVFLLCICVCVFSDHQLECKNSCTGHTWKAFLQCVWAYVASDEKHEHRNSHTAHIRRVSRVCTFRVPARAQVWSHWSQLKGFSLVCLRLCTFRSWDWAQEWAHWSHISCMGPHVIFQLLTMNERIVTLSTLVCFLSSVGLHVSGCQLVCRKSCIVYKWKALHQNVSVCESSVYWLVQEKLQCEHLNGFSPEWVSMCCLSLSACAQK